MTAKAGPRERLLAAARELTYHEGVGVGIDTILKTADVARASLYHHFGGKDGLITEVLKESAADDEAWYDQALAAYGDDPRARLLGVFDALDEIITRPGFRGCRFSTAEVSIADADHPAHIETRAHKERVRAKLLVELEKLGHPDAAIAADELLLLIEGAMVRATLAPETHPALTARRLAELIL